MTRAMWGAQNAIFSWPPANWNVGPSESDEPEAPPTASDAVAVAVAGAGEATVRTQARLATSVATITAPTTRRISNRLQLFVT